MPDGVAGRSGEDGLEQAALAGDARLIRGVGRRLVLFSGGTTLLILVVLGAALYAAVARSLAAAGTAQLDARAVLTRELIERPQRPGPGLGFAFGGDASGTFAILISPDGEPIVIRGLELDEGLPIADGVTAAQATLADDVRELTVEDVPLRVLSRPVQTDAGTFVIQVIKDRSDELRTLRITLLVLLGGGLVALLVASGFGALYARRALVPIRESLTAQRAALRRQRQFAADASHELRTPLTIIRGSVDDLRRHAAEPVASVGDALTDIEAEVAHLTRLVDDLLLLARSDSGAIALDRYPVDLGDVAGEAAGALTKAAVDAGVRLVVDPAPAMVLGDAARLRQVIVILLDNAIRHSPAGSEVRVTVAPDGPDAVLDVDDEGPGIPFEHLPHVFDRFYRAPGSGDGGAGLGLAIAAWIVEHHAGRIAAANRIDRGARFEVRIPRHGPAPASVGERVSEGSQPQP